MAEYVSCNYLQSGINFYPNDTIKVCCFSADAAVDVCSTRAPLEQIGDALLRKRRAMLEDFNSGNVYACCQKCPNLVRADWPEAPTQIRRVTLNHFMFCNLKCTHCGYLADVEAGRLVDTSDERVLQIVKQLKAQGLIAENALFDVGGGEPSVAPGLLPIVAYCMEKRHPMHINSNGAKFSEPFVDGLRQGLIHLTLTPDAGSREVYRSIKGRDAFKHTWDNIKKYHDASSSNIKVKFILQPANRDDVENMVAMCVASGVREVIVSLDLNIPVSEHSSFIPSIRKFRQLTAAHAVEVERSDLLPESLWNASEPPQQAAVHQTGVPFMDNLRRRNLQPFCPICGGSGRSFAPLPEYYREMSERHGFKYFGTGEMTASETYACAQCGASDRERLYAHWLQRSVDQGMLPRSISVMHFAPEAMLEKYLRHVRLFDNYSTADLMMDGVDHRGVDLMQLPFSDGSVDFFICSHVLEHVADDSRALQELWRITKPGGAGLVMAPIALGLTTTIEDPTETSPAIRWARFGQDDHVRLYAHADYVARIERAGFKVMQFGIEYFGADTFAALGLKPSSILYIALKDVSAAEGV